MDWKNPHRNSYNNPNSSASQFNRWVQDNMQRTVERGRREAQRSTEIYQNWKKGQDRKKEKPNSAQITTTSPLIKKSSGAIRPTRQSYPSTTTRPDRRIRVLVTILLLIALGLALVLSVPSLLRSGVPPTVTAPSVQQPVGDSSANNTIPVGVVKQVNTEGLNVRKSAGVDDNEPPLAQLSRGASVTLLGQSKIIGNRTWVLIKTGNISGWVRQDYLK